MGYDILAKSDEPVFQMAAEIALRHHERWDGSGYPDNLQGQDIAMSARIVALADVFDALTMQRPYKAAWPIEQVVATIHESSGSHFDPALVEVFDAVLPRICEMKSQWDSKEHK
jgi:putative two-component system response regulator